MVSRLFALKIVTYNTQRTGFVAPNLAHVLRRAKNASLPVKDKHHPSVSSLKKGNRGAFINKITDLGTSGGVIIEVCTYLHGVFPESGAVPFNKPELDLDAAQVNASGNKNSKVTTKEEALYRYRALVYGEAIVVEKASNTSAVLTLPYVLRAVLRTMLIDPTFPLPHLVNVGSRKLDTIIKSKGGVEKVVASLLVAKKQPKNKFAKLLSSARKGISGADSIQVIWASESADLSAKDVDAVYDEFEDEEVLSGVKVVFPGGSSVSDLSRYREQERYDLQADSNNRPYATSVHEALKSYMGELRSPTKGGPLTADGKLRDGYYLAGADDED